MCCSVDAAEAWFEHMRGAGVQPHRVGRPAKTTWSQNPKRRRRHGQADARTDALARDKTYLSIRSLSPNGSSHVFKCVKDTMSVVGIMDLHKLICHSRNSVLRADLKTEELALK